MNGRITMADVARKTGVHTTTVSLALRNHPSLPLTTRLRLQTIANQMGYQPDPALRALIDYRTRAARFKNIQTIAYLTHFDERWGWKKSYAHSEFFTGASARATRLGYRLEHFWLGEPRLSHHRMSHILSARGVTGLIIASHALETDLELQFDWSRFSAVKIDFLPHDPVLSVVTNDQRGIAQLAMKRAMAAGYRRIGFVMDRDWDKSVDLAWSAGFLAEQLNISEQDRVPMLSFSAQIPSGQRTLEAQHRHAGREELKRWLENHRPEVVISKSSFVRPVLVELGLSIPRDLSFVDLFLEDVDGKTAGIRQQHGRVGELAVEILGNQLQQHSYGVPEIPTMTLVAGSWHEGESMPRRSGARGLTFPVAAANLSP